MAYYGLIDWDQGRKMCIEDEEFYREVLEAFLEENWEQALGGMYEAESWEDYRIRVHSLKSNSKNIGAESLFEMAKECEMALKENRPQYVKAHHAELMKLYRKVEEEIRGYLRT